MAHKRIECPPIDPQLLEYLDAVFPDRAVDPSVNDPKEHYGSVKVVRHLKAVAEQQEENILVST